MTLAVRINGLEFSRYYDMNLIKITASTSAANSTIVTFTLIREDGYGVVATKTGVVAAGKATATIDIAKDCFDLDGVFRARQGKYHVHASVPTPEVADSSIFHIMVVTVKELKDKYMRGVDLLASGILEAQNYPFPLLTGVDIVNTAASQTRGIYPIVWDAAAKTLSWTGGTPVVIDMTQSSLLTQLVNLQASSYIEVRVVPDELPLSNVTQTVILDSAEIEDDVLRSFIHDAYQDIQGRLFVALEPTTYDTERVGDTSYDSTVFTDEYADPLTFYRDMFFPADKFLAVRFPHPWIFQHGFKRLEFFFNSIKTATIDKDQWLVNMTKGNTGLVEFVPKVGATLIFAWFTTAGLAFLTRWASIPSAWHYRVTAGLPDLFNEGRDRVRVAIARKAAIEGLVLAGLASTSLTSESTSKDGVSQSRSYAQGPGGRYSQIILQHQTFLYGPNGNSGEILKLRQRLLGLYGTTI